MVHFITVLLRSRCPKAKDAEAKLYAMTAGHYDCPAAFHVDIVRRWKQWTVNRATGATQHNVVVCFRVMILIASLCRYKDNQSIQLNIQ